MAEWEDRARVVAVARGWIGTPWHHMADIKGVGVDCAMLLVRVFVETGLVPPFDPRPYTRDWMLHRGEERFLAHLFAHAHEATKPRPGDAVVFKFGRCFSHGGIVSALEPLRVVHAFAPARIVLEEEIGRNADVGARLASARFASFWPAS